MLISLQHGYTVEGLQSVLVEVTGQFDSPVLISWLEYTPLPPPSALAASHTGAGIRIIFTKTGNVAKFGNRQNFISKFC